MKRNHSKKPSQLNYAGASDRAIIIAFRENMKRDNRLRKKLNAPIAKYDIKTKKAYLEYPDGRKVYSDQT